MPKLVVRVPHSLTPAEALARVQPALEKTVHDFQGQDLAVHPSANEIAFTFRSLAFTIRGQARVENDHVLVEVDLPFAALMFKDKAERAITKNLARALTPSTDASP